MKSTNKNKLQSQEPIETILLTVEEVCSMSFKDTQGLAMAIGTPGIDGVESVRILRVKILQHMRTAQIVDPYYDCDCHELT